MSKPETLLEREEQLERVRTERPRNFVERLIRFGAEFVLAIAFFLLGLTANIVATALAAGEDKGAIPAFVVGTIGVALVGLWKLAQQWEAAIDDEAEDIKSEKLVMRIADEIERRQAARNPEGIGSP